MDAAAFWNGVAGYNEATWPVQAVIILAAAYLTIEIAPGRDPERMSDEGVPCHSFAWNGSALSWSTAEPYRNLGTPLFLTVAVLFIVDIFTRKTRFRFPPGGWARGSPRVDRAGATVSRDRVATGSIYPRVLLPLFPAPSRSSRSRSSRGRAKRGPQGLPSPSFRGGCWGCRSVSARSTATRIGPLWGGHIRASRADPELGTGRTVAEAGSGGRLNGRLMWGAGLEGGCKQGTLARLLDEQYNASVVAQRADTKRPIVGPRTTDAGRHGRSSAIAFGSGSQQSVAGRRPGGGWWREPIQPVLGETV